MHRLPALVALALLAACSTELPRSVRLTVGLDGVPVPGEVDNLRVRITAGSEPGGSTCLYAERSRDLGRSGELPWILDVLPGERYGSWVGFRIEWRRGETVRASRSLVVTWPVSGRLEVDQTLDRGCLDLACPEGTQCEESGCVASPEVLDPDLWESGAAPCDREVDHWDGGPICEPALGGECDPVADCGCAGGETCSLRSAGSPPEFCRGPGSLADDAPCTDDAQCGPGLVCADAEEYGRICRRLCDGDGDCASGRGCLDLPADTGVSAWTAYGICAGPYVDCNPVQGDGPDPQSFCPSGQTCHLPPGGATYCGPFGSLPAGTDCTGRPSECGSGSICLTIGSNTRCYRYCRFDATPPQCPAGQYCQPHLGDGRIGVCSES